MKKKKCKNVFCNNLGVSSRLVKITQCLLDKKLKKSHGKDF